MCCTRTRVCSFNRCQRSSSSLGWLQQQPRPLFEISSWQDAPLLHAIRRKIYRFMNCLSTRFLHSGHESGDSLHVRCAAPLRGSTMRCEGVARLFTRAGRVYVLLTIPRCFWRSLCLVFKHLHVDACRHSFLAFVMALSHQHVQQGGSHASDQEQSGCAWFT
jgi:hypothetical protein